jgi:hypothetical protein
MKLPAIDMTLFALYQKAWTRDMLLCGAGKKNKMYEYVGKKK